MKLSGLALIAAIALGGAAPALAQDKVEVHRTVTTTTSSDGPDVRHHWHHGRHKVCRTHWYHHRKVTRCTWRRW
jgi:hypothetical protein